MTAHIDEFIAGAGNDGDLQLCGRWITPHLVAIETQSARLPPPQGPALRLDASDVEAMDTGGAWLLCRLVGRFEAQGIAVQVDGLRQEYARLVELVRSRFEELPPPASPARVGGFERIGRVAVQHTEEVAAMLAFIGEVAFSIWRTIRAPWRIRWQPLLRNVESAGVDALPIISLLSFLIGIVIAYQAAVQLQKYGANIFIVELVVLSIFRELGPLMSAIIVAGRTGSAYTAEIGTMKVTEEVDALRTIGIPPLDLLVLPKLFGLMLVLPLLTLVADAAGVFGGMVIASSLLDVSFGDFLKRIPEVVHPNHFVIGIGKAPVFAMVIAAVGCLQGFRTAGSADSVGRQTTVSVVQSIFLVIVVDAAFSVLLNWMGI